MGRAVAKQICSSYGNSVGLPVPRFPEENVFYLKYFGHDELWLGISNSDQGSTHHLVRGLLGPLARTARNTWNCLVAGPTSALIPDSDSNGQNIYKSDNGQTLFGSWTINPYHQWINYGDVIDSGENGVAMSRSSLWQGKDENNMLDSVCVFNVIPDECSKCPNKNYCRYITGSRTVVECMQSKTIFTVFMCKTSLEAKQYLTTLGEIQ